MRDNMPNRVKTFLRYFLGTIFAAVGLGVIGYALNTVISLFISLFSLFIGTEPSGARSSYPLAESSEHINGSYIVIGAILVVILMAIALWLFLRYDKKKMDERDRGL